MDDNVIELQKNAEKVMEKELIPTDDEKTKEKFINIDYKKNLIIIPM